MSVKEDNTNSSPKKFLTQFIHNLNEAYKDSLATFNEVFITLLIAITHLII